MGIFKPTIEDDIEEVMKSEKIDKDLRPILNNILNKLNELKNNGINIDAGVIRHLKNFLKNVEKDIKAAKAFAENASLLLNRLKGNQR